MPEIRFHAVQGDGTPGEQVGVVSLDGATVTATPGVAADTIAMLARRFGRTDVHIFGLIRDRGWSNGQIVAVHHA